MPGERAREADVVISLNSVLGDLRYALRALRRSPDFALVAVGSLALGVDANTAIYTLVDALMVRSLPVPHPEDLVQINGGLKENTGGTFTNPFWEQLRAWQGGMTVIAAFGETRENRADLRRVRLGLTFAYEFPTIRGISAGWQR